MSGDDRQFFVEQMDDALRQIGEIIAPLKDDVNKIKAKVQEIDEIKTDIKIIKTAVAETNKDMRNQDARITRLEQLAA